MPQRAKLRAYLALAAVYFFWGTTYLAIRISLEAFPALVLLSARFLLSGTLMLAGAWFGGAKLPKGRELWLTAFFGVIILGGGNGCLIWAEQTVPSGLAALLLVTGPFWMVGLGAALPGGEKIHIPALAGILIGCAGVVILMAPNGFNTSFSATLVNGFIVLQLGCFFWCLGSLLHKRAITTVHPSVSGGVQQFATGIVFLLPALLLPGHPIQWNVRSNWALAYLVVFGSVVGYSAFLYALENLPVAIVSTYNYVNPVVAMALGWLFYREPFGRREFLAMAIIFTGVAIVKWAGQENLAIPSPGPSRPEHHPPQEVQ
ncbi:MAG: EamA family transporter [Bryobacteraceae bacterium]